MDSPGGGGARTTRRVTIPIYGFTCAGSGALVAERALLRVPGVARVYVNAFTEMAYVEYEPTVTGVEQLAQAIGRAGLRAGNAAPV